MSFLLWTVLFISIFLHFLSVFKCLAFSMLGFSVCSFCFPPPLVLLHGVGLATQQLSEDRLWRKDAVQAVLSGLTLHSANTSVSGDHIGF